jgi:hypothetical protein
MLLLRSDQEAMVTMQVHRHLTTKATLCLMQTQTIKAQSRATKAVRCENRRVLHLGCRGDLVYVNLNNVFNLRRLQTVLVWRGLQML